MHSSNFPRNPHDPYRFSNCSICNGKTALVTGGSRGLGLQMAHALGEAGARDHADLAQGRRPGGGHGRNCRPPASTRAGSPRTARKEEEIRRLADETLHAHGRRRHPGQQRRRRLGRAGRGSSGRSLGQADEPERARLFHPVAAHRQAQHDRAQVRPHHQHRLDRRPGRQPAGDADAGLQHLQGRGDQLHPGAGLRMGQVQHHRERDLPRLLPEQDDASTRWTRWARTSWRPTRRCSAWATTRT